MATPVVWQSKFQINTGTAATGSQSTPKIIGLDNGDVVVVWIEDAAGAVSSGIGRNIVAKVYNSEGEVVVDAKPLTTAFSNLDEYDFDIAATNDAGFVIAFIGQNTVTPNNSSLIHARFDLDLNLVNSGALENETTAAEAFNDVSIAYDHLADRSIVSFTKTETDSNTEIYTYAVTSSGVSGAPTNISNSASANSNSDVAILSNGNYLTVFEAVSGNDYIFSRVSQSDGTSVSGVTGANSANPLDTPSAASLNGGGHITVFRNNINPMIFDTSDNLAFGNTAQKTVNDESTGPATNTQVVVLPDGDFVVAWMDGANNNALRARRYNPDRSQDGDIMEVTLADGGVNPDEVVDYHMSVTADGRILFTWIDAADNEVYASIFDPRGETIDVADFQTNTTNFIEAFDVIGRVNGGTINGDTNDNILIGLDGNDTLNGGADKDTLIGGAGNDLLDGGTGRDDMSGKRGNDTYLVDDTRDKVSETGGNGTDLVKAKANFTLANGVENLVLLGNGNLKGNGNSAKNKITGNKGKNELDGKGGNDTIIGGGGKDTLDGGGGKDSLNGGGGDDMLIGGKGNDTLVGGGGSDTAKFAGTFGSYTISKKGNKVQVKGKDGTDILSGVEKLKFGSKIVKVKDALKKGIEAPSKQFADATDSKNDHLTETGESDKFPGFGEASLSADDLLA